MTNMGKVTVNTIVVTDSLGIPVSSQATILAPNAGTTCAAIYTSTLADYNASSLTNIATASGQDLQGGPVISNPDSETFFVGAPVLEPDSLIYLLYGLAGILLLYAMHRSGGKRAA